MQTSSLHSLMLPPRPFSGNISRRKAGFYRRKCHSNSVLAPKRDARDEDHNGSRYMVVLRKKIWETRTEKMKDETLAAGWSGRRRIIRAIIRMCVKQ
ncbi:hypothetical protein RJ640_030084 [Escallonia rubra]|uniref:Uncharacterized protein n=1 Tax=Escallonia rubra TaxID=112253 RepID=A0AA88U1G8_9ASTE|nr:hypothetical protein RJ640_030084 [Escallonia rubra]